MGEIHLQTSSMDDFREISVLGDDRRISVLACVMIVVLRLSIGWHLLYEGWWKIDTQHTAHPWSAEGYLKNAVGPMRPVFRQLTGDPSDLNWLDHEKMTEKWSHWRDRFLKHYGANDEDLENSLNLLLDGPESFTQKLDALPPGVNLQAKGIDKQAIRFDAKSKQLIVDGKRHLLPSERDLLLSQAADQEGDAAGNKQRDAFRAAINEVFKKSSKLSYYERLTALLTADPDRVGTIIRDKTPKSDGGEAPIIEKRMGDIEKYKEDSARYERNLAKAKQAFQFDHLDRQWKEVMELRKRVVGPVQALEADLKVNADKLLSADQLAKGPVPEPWTEIRKINWRTMWGLTIFGVLLILGLCTRPAAVGGACLLALFYLAAPPWPGVPEVPGPEHNFIVNKVFMEIMSLLMIATLPTGRWFGLDAMFHAWWARRQFSKSS